MLKPDDRIFRSGRGTGTPSPAPSQKAIQLSAVNPDYATLPRPAKANMGQSAAGDQLVNESCRHPRALRRLPNSQKHGYTSYPFVFLTSGSFLPSKGTVIAATARAHTAGSRIRRTVVTDYSLAKAGQTLPIVERRHAEHRAGVSPTGYPILPKRRDSG